MHLILSTFITILGIIKCDAPDKTAVLSAVNTELGMKYGTGTDQIEIGRNPDKAQVYGDSKSGDTLKLNGQGLCADRNNEILRQCRKNESSTDFYVEKDNNNTYVIRGKTPGNWLTRKFRRNMCLTAEGNRVNYRKCNGNRNQRWKIEEHPEKKNKRAAEEAKKKAEKAKKEKEKADKKAKKKAEEAKKAAEKAQKDKASREKAKKKAKEAKDAANKAKDAGDKVKEAEQRVMEFEEFEKEGSKPDNKSCDNNMPQNMNQMQPWINYTGPMNISGTPMTNSQQSQMPNMMGAQMCNNPPTTNNQTLGPYNEQDMSFYNNQAPGMNNSLQMACAMSGVPMMNNMQLK